LGSQRWSRRCSSLFQSCENETGINSKAPKAGYFRDKRGRPQLMLRPTSKRRTPHSRGQWKRLMISVPDRCWRSGASRRSAVSEIDTRRLTRSSAIAGSRLSWLVVESSIGFTSAGLVQVLAPDLSGVGVCARLRIRAERERITTNSEPKGKVATQQSGHWL
jgi:hypothetical protein